IKCGVQLWDGVHLEDDVYVGPNASFTNDIFPRSKKPPPAFARTVLRRGCSVGANATILPGIEIGANAMVGAGAVVTRSVPTNATVVGTPATISGYVRTGEKICTASNLLHIPAGSLELTKLNIGGATLRQMRVLGDMRGDLTVGEFERDLPFPPK